MVCKIEQKFSNPVNEDDIRVISLTAFFSKVFERFVMDWLLYYLKDIIDLAQYGGQKGSSITHYLVDFINFVLYNQDLKNIHAVLAVAVDFSKAFNRQNHNLLITLLSDLGVPGWLLSIVIGFLENRELIVNVKGKSSERQTWKKLFFVRKRSFRIKKCPQSTMIDLRMKSRQNSGKYEPYKGINRN